MPKSHPWFRANSGPEQILDKVRLWDRLARKRVVPLRKPASELGRNPETEMKMRGKTATLAGAAALAALPAAAAAAPAAGPAVPVASSYAELLTPIPNAVERLARSDAEETMGAPELIEVQYRHHHHHHHHNAWWYRRHHYVFFNGAWILRNPAWYRSNGYVFYNGGWVLRPRRHHHHHHHHNSY